LVEVTDGASLPFPGANAFFECSVIELTLKFELALEGDGLLERWVESDAESSAPTRLFVIHIQTIEIACHMNMK
jgi:hypothetical protein